MITAEPGRENTTTGPELTETLSDKKSLAYDHLPSLDGLIADRFGMGRKILGLSGGAAIFIALILVFFVAPMEREMGIVQRVFYFHVSADWIAGLGLSINFIATLAYLIKRNLFWDRLAAAAAETAFPFLMIGLVTGSIWAKPIWHVWWDWNDLRLTTFAFLCLIFVGYHLLRSWTDNRQTRANLSAALAIFGFADVPVVFFSTRWWTTTHPVVFGASTGSVKMGLDSTMMAIFMFCLVAFTLFYSFLLLYRLRLAAIDEALSSIEAVVQAREDY